jgi:hypothetical protein
MPNAVAELGGSAYMAGRKRDEMQACKESQLGKQHPVSSSAWNNMGSRNVNLNSPAAHVC